MIVFCSPEKKYSPPGADASMADAREASSASHFCSDRLNHASQSSPEEPVRAHGRVRCPVLLAVLVWLTGNIGNASSG